MSDAPTLPPTRGLWWLALAGAAMVALAGAAVTALAGDAGLPTGALVMAQFTLMAGAALALGAAFGPTLTREDFSVRRGGAGWTLFVAVAGLALFLLASDAFERRVPGAEAAGRDVLASLGFGAGAAGDWLTLLAVAGMGPLAEELCFRGLVFRSLRDALLRLRALGRLAMPLATGIAALASGWAFMEIHGGGGQEAQLGMLLMFGVLMALAYQVTGSLLAPVAIHAANNALAVWQGLRGPGGLGAEVPAGAAWLGPLLALAVCLLARALLPGPRAPSPGRQGS